MADDGKQMVVQEPHEVAEWVPVDPEIAKKKMDNYQEVCRRILDKSDYQTIYVWDPVQRKKVARDFKKKSAARKLAKAFTVSTEFKRDEPIDLPGGDTGWTVTVEASTSDGRREAGDGMVERTFDDGGKGEDWHKVRATAVTRAKNRATFDLVGMGEVSAEEMHGQKGVSTHAPPQEQPITVDATVESVTTDEPMPEPDRSDLPEYKWIREDIAREKGYMTDGIKFFIPKDGQNEGVKMIHRDNLFKLKAEPAAGSVEIPPDLGDGVFDVDQQGNPVIAGEEEPPFENSPAPTAGLTPGMKRANLQSLSRKSNTSLSEYIKVRRLGTLKEICDDEIRYETLKAALTRLAE